MRLPPPGGGRQLPDGRSPGAAQVQRPATRLASRGAAAGGFGGAINTGLTPLPTMVSAPCSDVASHPLRPIHRFVPLPHQGRKRSKVGRPASMKAMAPTIPASAIKTSAPNMLSPRPGTGGMRLERS